MTQITARVSAELAESLDAAAATLRRSRADVIRQALESYLEDFDDLTVALERLRDPADPVLDWMQSEADSPRPLGVTGSVGLPLSHHIQRQVE